MLSLCTQNFLRTASRSRAGYNRSVGEVSRFDSWHGHYCRVPSRCVAHPVRTSVSWPRSKVARPEHHQCQRLKICGYTLSSTERLRDVALNWQRRTNYLVSLHSLQYLSSRFIGCRPFEGTWSIPPVKHSKHRFDFSFIHGSMYPVTGVSIVPSCTEWLCFEPLFSRIPKFLDRGDED